MPKAVNRGDVLFAHVYLDPDNPPSEIMLQCLCARIEHRRGPGGEKYQGPIIAHLDDVFFNTTGQGFISRAEVRLILEREDIVVRVTFM